jgi:hypothetical protein
VYLGGKLKKKNILSNHALSFKETQYFRRFIKKKQNSVVGEAMKKLGADCGQ